MPDPRASAVIDLDALRANYARVREVASPAEVIPVVKADAYGHGMVSVARELRSCGAGLLGVALPREARALRAAGDRGAILAWLWSPGDPDVAECVADGIDLSVSSDWALEEVAAAAQARGTCANVHVKVDTGLSRNGVPTAQLRDVLEAAHRAELDGDVKVVGLWSHLADGEIEGSQATAQQARAFDEALALARAVGLEPSMSHLGNSGAAWAQPGWPYGALRSGIAIYGLSPGDGLGSSSELGLRPVMTLRARLAHVKPVPAGTRVSYGGTWESDRDTVLGLVPLGYADGIPRTAGGAVQVQVGGRRAPVVGRVAMDQFVIDLGPGADDAAGDEVVCFGTGDHGEPTADEWASRLGTIGYEIVTRIGPRVPREHVGGLPDGSS